MTRALLIPVDDTPKPVDMNSLADIQRLVGGYVECANWIFGDDSGIVVYINDEGKFTCPPNRAVFADKEGVNWNGTPIRVGDVVDVLHGPILCVGDDGEGGDADLTNEQMAMVMKRFGADTVGSGLLASIGLRLIAKCG